MDKKLFFTLYLTQKNKKFKKTIIIAIFKQYFLLNNFSGGFTEKHSQIHTKLHFFKRFLNSKKIKN